MDVVCYLEGYAKTQPLASCIGCGFNTSCIEYITASDRLSPEENMELLQAERDVISKRYGINEDWNDDWFYSEYGTCEREPIERVVDIPDVRKGVYGRRR